MRSHWPASTPTAPASIRTTTSTAAVILTPDVGGQTPFPCDKRAKGGARARAPSPSAVARHNVLRSGAVMEDDIGRKQPRRSGNTTCSAVTRPMSEATHRAWRSVVGQPLEVDPFEPVSSNIAVDIAAASICGRSSVLNTDHYLALRLARTQETIATSLAAADLPGRFEEDAYSLVVADGVGDQAAGARASRLAVSALAHLGIRYGRWSVRVGPETPSVIATQGEFFYRQVNDLLRRASRLTRPLADMATSQTALYIAERHLFYAHVGHSKAFLFRRGILVQLTPDHTGDGDEPDLEPGPR